MLVPTKELKKYTDMGFVPLTSLSTEQSKNFLREGILEWSNKKWEINKPEITSNSTLSGSSEPLLVQEQNSDNFIKIIDFTPSISNSNTRLSFYKKSE